MPKNTKGLSKKRWPEGELEWRKGGTGGSACPGRAYEAERTRRFSRVPYTRLLLLMVLKHMNLHFGPERLYLAGHACEPGSDLGAQCLPGFGDLAVAVNQHRKWDDYR
jgi:hypothetical protein